MLVLSRKVGQSIQIADNIKLHVLSIRGKVRLGIEAPTGVAIVRSELLSVPVSSSSSSQGRQPLAV